MTTDVVITDTFLVEVNELVAKAHKLLSDEPYGTTRNKRAIDVHYRLELAAQTLEESYPDEVMLRASVWNAADRLVIETFKMVPAMTDYQPKHARVLNDLRECSRLGVQP